METDNGEFALLEKTLTERMDTDFAGGNEGNEVLTPTKFFVFIAF
jgi:hypothetical protein